jgi:hypothetical protein
LKWVYEPDAKKRDTLLKHYPRAKPARSPTKSSTTRR